MADCYEIDFLTVGETQSGDAITIRYELNGSTFIHVVDGGFQDDGPKVMEHLRNYYGGHGISHIVVTHPDGDHAAGLQAVLEECSIYSGGGLAVYRARRVEPEGGSPYGPRPWGEASQMRSNALSSTRGGRMPRGSLELSRLAS